MREEGPEKPGCDEEDPFFNGEDEIPALPQTPKKFHPVVQALLQSLFIGGYVLLVFLAVYRFNSKIAIASLAASAFIAFGFPNAESGRPKYLIGGYASAVVSGLFCSFIFHSLPGELHTNIYYQIAFSALAVLATSFVMICLKLQHPPSCALAVSLVLDPSPWAMGLIVMVCIILLAVIKVVVNRWLSRRCD